MGKPGGATYGLQLLRWQLAPSFAVAAEGRVQQEPKGPRFPTCPWQTALPRASGCPGPLPSPSVRPCCVVPVQAWGGARGRRAAGRTCWGPAAFWKAAAEELPPVEQRLIWARLAGSSPLGQMPPPPSAGSAPLRSSFGAGWSDVGSLEASSSRALALSETQWLLPAEETG